VPVGEPHDAPEGGDEVVGDALVEQVAHRVHEDALRLLPQQRLFEHLRLKGQPKAVPVVRLVRHCHQPQ
jgi:hypothetical protein